MLSQVSNFLKELGSSFKSDTTGPKPTVGRIRVGSREVEDIGLISQGGYAYIFKVRDVFSGELFALKQMICQSEERYKTAMNELNVLKSLPPHPNLLRAYDSEVVRGPNGTQVLVLLELCPDGSVFDLMVKHESDHLNERQIIFIMREICEGVKVLHSMNPPLAHRDLKIENILLANKKFKICDFGSCSSKIIDFSKISKDNYHVYEQEFDKNTTLMYRPPEMCDPYQGLVVSEKVDVWMLGCIMFTIAFYVHPFMEMSKLSIVNAAFRFPTEGNKYPEKLCDLIRLMLTRNPNMRPSVFDISKIFNNYFELDYIKLNSDAQQLKDEEIKKEQELKKYENNSRRKIKQFDGDIPIDEIMKLQKKVMRDPRLQDKYSDQNFKDMGQLAKKNNASDFNSFDNFGGTKKGGLLGDEDDDNNFSNFGITTEKPGLKHYHSAHYGEKNNQDTNLLEFNENKNTSNNGGSNFDPFEAFNFGNQGQNTTTQKPKDNNTWANFDFGSAPSQQTTNQNNSNNAGWLGDWGNNQKNTTQNSSNNSQTKQLNDAFANFSFGNNTKSNANSNAQNTNTQRTNPPKKEEFVDLLGLEEDKKAPTLDQLSDIKF